MAKVRYEPVAPYHRVSITRGDGTTLEVELGSPYAPADADEERALSEHPLLKRAGDDK